MLALVIPVSLDLKSVDTDSRLRPGGAGELYADARAARDPSCSVLMGKWALCLLVCGSPADDDVTGMG